MYAVAFHKVGRYKKSWQCQMRYLTSAAILESLAENKALTRPDADVDWTPGYAGGAIWTGHSNLVGRFSAQRIVGT
jgi:hypothetical protein